jgi:hypothetical protein
MEKFLNEKNIKQKLFIILIITSSSNEDEKIE